MPPLRRAMNHRLLEIQFGKFKIVLGPGLNFLELEALKFWIGALSSLKSVLEAHKPLEAELSAKRVLLRWDDLEYSLELERKGESVFPKKEVLSVFGKEAFVAQNARFREGEFVLDAFLEGQAKVEALPEPYPLALHPLFMPKDEALASFRGRIKAWLLCDLSGDVHEESPAVAVALECLRKAEGFAAVALSEPRDPRLVEAVKRGATEAEARGLQALVPQWMASS